jgi:isopentenyl-diphosphate delta-isomerase
VDVAKAIRLGADLVGIAAGLLEAATISAEAVDVKLGVLIDQLRITCFCTGAPSLADLRTVRLMA